MRFNDIHINFVIMRTVLKKILMYHEKIAESEAEVYLIGFCNNGKLEPN